jgi:hypothetical protein
MVGGLGWTKDDMLPMAGSDLMVIKSHYLIIRPQCYGGWIGLDQR